MTTVNRDANPRQATQTQQEFSFELSTSASVQLSQCQRMGCFMRVIDGIKACDSQDKLLEQQYAVEHLTNIEGFDISTA